jgi:hypothetical protein
MNGKDYFENKSDRLPSGNIDISELEVGRMIVPDPDLWMLGDRWVIEDMNDDFIIVQLYCCGKKHPWKPCKMEKSSLLKWWMKDEWFENWKNKFK